MHIQCAYWSGTWFKSSCSHSHLTASMSTEISEMELLHALSKTGIRHTLSTSRSNVADNELAVTIFV
jgi:hypothetical protein